MDLLSLVMVAVLIEAIIQVIKPIFNPDAGKLTIPEIISIGIGVVIALLARINLLEGLVSTDSTILLYILYVLTGVALGRGPSFVHDLWLKLRSGYGDEL